LLRNLEQLHPRHDLEQFDLVRVAQHLAHVLGPLVTVCLLQPVGREPTACCAALLIAASVWLRFRNRAGLESVTTGLIAGAIPLATLLLLARFDPGCASAGLVSYCTGFSLLVGAAAGAIVAWRERARAPKDVNWLMALGIAVTTAGLGCARLGFASLAGVARGMLAGRASARGPELAA
jgi:hypothetical protein